MLSLYCNQKKGVHLEDATAYMPHIYQCDTHKHTHARTHAHTCAHTRATIELFQLVQEDHDTGA